MTGDERVEAEQREKEARVWLSGLEAVKGKLGEHIRCVVSVSMLTEGWDANTVTHILGVRAFGTQLLCEQVVGRGLRRMSYAANDAGPARSQSTRTSTACRSRSSRRRVRAQFNAEARPDAHARPGAGGAP